MKCLFTLITCLLCWRHQQSAPASTELENSSLSKDMKALSQRGEEYVEQEVMKALLGVKQMKTIVEINEEKHEKILKSLRKTKEEKMETVRLFEDINEELSEAETQCKQLLKNNWDICKACLEWSCITFYTNSCSQQGLQTLLIKAQESFKTWPPLSISYENVGGKKKSEYYMAAQVSETESVFSQLIHDVNTLFNQSILFFKNFQYEFDESFQNSFLSDVSHLDMDTNHTTTTVPDRKSVIVLANFEHWDLSEFLQSLYEFGQSILEVISNVFSMMYNKFCNGSEGSYAPLQASPGHLRSEPSNMMCGDLHNASECLLFQERCQLCYGPVMEDCPDAIELLMKLEEASKLVQLSTNQYEEVVQLVQQHTDETSNLVKQLIDRFGWVARHSNMTSATDTMFNIEMVSLSPNTENPALYDIVSEVRIFTPPNVIIRVPASFDVDSTEFIQYIADKALEHHKNRS
ncbi:clusterin-like protein 1 [Pseudophryne corroboree]|uniref:clusterin-like protein 1 n=1 Tax=Pseudophryne corroboree TaxID=495146 RepID=UPI0030813991